MQITRERIEYIRTTETVDITIPYYYKMSGQNRSVTYGKVYSEDLRSIEISERSKHSPTGNSFDYDYCLNASLVLTPDSHHLREVHTSTQKEFDAAQSRMKKYINSILENE